MTKTEDTGGNISPLRTFCWGVLHALGMFDISKVSRLEKREESGGFFAADTLGLEERIDCGDERAWFNTGEVVMAGMLALTITVPAGFWFATRTSTALALTGAAVLFLPLFVLLPKLIRQAMKADTEVILVAFGKNEHMKKVFWAVFVALAGFVLAQVAEPEMVETVIGILAGT